MRRRRGFTLLEVMLAAMLGAMVVVACVGLFGAIESQTQLGRARFGETLEIGLTHGTAERAIQLLVMSDSPPPVEPTARSRERANQEDPEAETAPEEPLAPPETPRFVLEPDPGLSGSIELYDGRRISPQRLEVALRSPPVFVPTEARSPEEVRETRRERRSREEAEVEDPDAVEIAIAPGIRGVFELEFVPDNLGGTWSLWWRQFGAETGMGESETDWPEGMAPGRIRLASELTRVHWQVFRGNEMRDALTATWPDDLPAYVQLEIESIRGTNHQWLFEVGWTVGKEPGTESSTPLARESANPNDPTQRPGGAQPVPAPPNRNGRVPAAGDQHRESDGGGR